MFAIKEGGYVALLSVIIIGVTLLAMIFQESASGAQLRLQTLGTESKEQARTLAEMCTTEALAKLFSDPSYRGDITNNSTIGVCHIFPITVSAPGIAIIKTQGRVRGYYANMILISQFPITCPPKILPQWHEVPTLE